MAIVGAALGSYRGGVQIAYERFAHQAAIETGDSAEYAPGIGRSAQDSHGVRARGR